MKFSPIAFITSSVTSKKREATIMNFSAPCYNQLARGGHVILDQSERRNYTKD